VDWEKGEDFNLFQLATPVSILATTGFVVSLERAYKDKKRALRERVKGRDLFDLWWLRQRLGKKERFLANGRFDKQAIESELKRFLPKGNWWLISELFSKR
jgi:predicted nucleotidyltransferase component of viral defense system